MYMQIPMAGTLPEELGTCFPELNSFKYSFNQVTLCRFSLKLHCQADKT